MKSRKPCLVDQFIQIKLDIACLSVETNTFEYVPKNTQVKRSGRMCVTFQGVDCDLIFISERILDI